MSSNSNANEKDPDHRNTYSLPLIVLAGLIVIGALAASLSPKQNDLPNQLMGVWKTDEASHSSLFL
jgi:hypothetical protein